MIEYVRPSFSTVSERYEAFAREVQQLINRHSLEQVSDTPDFVLARYLRDCLMAWDCAAQTRAMWYETKELRDAAQDK